MGKKRFVNRMPRVSGPRGRALLRGWRGRLRLEARGGECQGDPSLFPSVFNALQAIFRRLRVISSLRKDLCYLVYILFSRRFKRSDPKRRLFSLPLFGQERFKSSCLWFSSLISRQSSLEPVHERLGVLGAKRRRYELRLGRNVKWVVAWSFFRKSQRPSFQATEKGIRQGRGAPGAGGRCDPVPCKSGSRRRFGCRRFGAHETSERA